MNLETLKQYLRTVTEFDWCGNKILLRKLSTADALAMFATLREAGESREAVIAFHVELAAKSLANEAGDLEFDNDEGRATLRQVGFDDLVALGEIVLKHNGYGDEKKSGAQTSVSSSSSAESLDPHSSTPAS